jgi:hypothetical protein
MSLFDTITHALFPGSASKKVTAPGTKSHAEMRKFVRVPQRMRGGFLWSEKLIAARPCVIKDLSVTGARIDLAGDPVKLSLLADGARLYFSTEKHEIPCSVRWSKGKSLGLRFEGKPRPPSHAYK